MRAAYRHLDLALIYGNQSEVRSFGGLLVEVPPKHLPRTLTGRICSEESYSVHCETGRIIHHDKGNLTLRIV